MSSPQPPRPDATSPGPVLRERFGIMPDGREIGVYTLRNASGLEVRAIDYGGTIVSLRAPDRHGRLADVVLGFDSLDSYLEGSPYFGAIVGRFGNRIAEGRFTLDGQTYVLAQNDGSNHLHGGRYGFDKVVWEATPFRTEQGSGVGFTYTSPDGEEGYPGTLQVRVTYTLNDAGELTVEYDAVTDRPTPVNLTQHSYFNLAGHGDVLGHEMQIHADAFIPVDDRLIPTGEIRSVAGTPFDFRQPTPIGARIEQDDEQLRLGRGYDHTFVLPKGTSPVPAARVVEPESGRVLEVLTTEPGVQFYSGNFLDGSLTGKQGTVYHRRTGFCLETQHFPDSPNQPGFPSTILRPGERLRSRTVFRFSTDAG